MTTFDDVLPTVLRICHAAADFQRIRQACVVRDLRGRVRLVVEPEQPSPDLESLTSSLHSALGDYFAGPILSTQGTPEERRLARNVLDRSEAWPEPWPDEIRDLVTGNVTPIDRGRWRAVQRLLSKQSWLEGTEARAPWPLVARTPSIVAFYSFKGGVGRSTILAATAWNLVREGKRVAVLDLDLEAPGIGAFLGVEPTGGIVDFLVDHAAAGSADSSRCRTSAMAFANEAAQVSVYPAGAMSWSYLEKLARLDYASDLQASPAGAALRELLEQIKRNDKPDFILIDSRAGLHDLGGLSLHGLSHVDVLVTRASTQSYDGLSLTLQALVRRKLPSELRILLTQGFAARATDVGGPEFNQHFDETVYRLFQEHVYAGSDDAPSLEDDQAPHFPVRVHAHDEVARASVFSQVPASVWESDDFKELCQRIQERCAPEDGEE